MNKIGSNKYGERPNAICLEIQKCNMDHYEIAMYKDRYWQQYIGKIEVANYTIDKNQSEITLLDSNDNILGILRYRIIYNMEN